MSRQIPAPEQIEATRPDRSNWVGANAGSGKTHVLTGRVARLLLAGAEPQKILCLTYTRAAAAEMQTRLFRTLGDWAMAPEDTLAERLADISGADAPPSAATLAAARRLFARALETPGGLKIQTIHAFCTMLLRRFPLEAGISPRFEVADDRQTARILAAVRTDMALAAEAGGADGFDRAARTLNEDGIDKLAAAVLGTRAAFGGDVEAALAAHFGAAAATDRQQIARAALAALDIESRAALRDVLLARGKTSERPVGEALAALGADDTADPADRVADLMSRVLTQKFERRSPHGFPSVDVKKARPAAAAELDALGDWALDTRDRLLAAEIAGRTRDLHAFAGGLLGGLDAAKTARGLLDYDDLVTRAQALLTDRDMRAWVLYKLDQGIDHILVDEAQDTSPAQWAIITAIADEFLSGEGAQPAGRSIFVVGDEKQSIYSFQGAEPRALGTIRQQLHERLEALGTPLQSPALETSYRSAPAILDFVDRVFLGAEGELTADAGPLRHRAHRALDQGRVDLWPPIAREAAPEEGPWDEPVDAPAPGDPKTLLAAAVAGRIAAMIREGTPRPARAGAPPCAVRPGDVLVLVTVRDRLARGIIRGLKTEGIAVAGADRLSLTGELAVQDLLALVRVCLLPSDDLSLAALLRSPLCGVSEDALFALAHGRQGTLWQALDASAHADAAAFLADMAAHADFERPYEFLERALIRHDGRRRLIARLGPEAEDPIDELLVQALVYEGHAAPSLAGFLAWLEAGEITVKREMDRGLDCVRVMTVHGAKGLEAPVVILPDTVFAGARGGGRPVLLELPGDGNAPPLTVWAAAKERDDTLTRAAREAAEARDRAERARLLYVALTRAEDWLILCAAAPAKGQRPESWYPRLEAAMTALAGDPATAAGVTALPSPTGDGEMLRYETGPLGAPADTPPADATERAPAPEEALPDWLCPAPPETRVERASPSGLAAHTAPDAAPDDAPDDDAAPGAPGLAPADARARGTAVHLILERLASHPPEARATLATNLIAAHLPELSPPLVADAIAEAGRVLAMPGADAIFGPGSLAEVSVAIDPPAGGPRMIGRIDRLVPGDDRVLIVDIKTDARPPADPSGVPAAYLAQLGAYAAGVAPAWPGRPVALAILWTAAPALMEVDAEAAGDAFRTVSFARTGRS